MVKAAKRKASKPDVADLVARYQDARRSGGQAYQRADRLIKEIAAAVKPGEEIELTAAGRKAVLVDKFASVDIIWTPTAARRWELKILEP
jgi:hypothetical protein